VRFRIRAARDGYALTDQSTKNVNLINANVDYTDEEMDMDQAQVQTAVDVLGKITVSVQRGELKELPARSPRTLWDGYDPPDTEVSSKAVVKDNHVSHSIR
jgi:predicted component of type VI protein secretion system